MLLLAATLAATLTGARAMAAPRVVQTEGGPVSGTGDAVHVYRGIPYAAPPVGPLRWKPPQPPHPWTGVRDGSKFGADCVQPPYYPELRGAGQGEDCLSLNVWTPAAADAGSQPKLPVMVWIFGGGFVNGSGSHPTYDGMGLASRGVVLVTINYRLGLLGFMAHPELTAESPTHTSGNYALMDQLAALGWFARNIAAFGGDPARVTLFGQSAGALSIEALLTSPAARGLFGQVILQSVGAMRRPLGMGEAERAGLKLGPDIAALRNLSPAELNAKLKPTEDGFRDVTGPRGLGPVVDGVLLPRSDREAFASGNALFPPMIVGGVANEGGAFTRSAPIRTPADLEAYLDRNFPGRQADARNFYPAATDTEARRQLDLLFSDTQFGFGTRELLRLVVPRQQHVWRYVFARHRDGDGPTPVHGDELQYVFGNLSGVHKGRTRPFDADDSALSREMMDTWVRFAATGDPNGGELPRWPAYDPASDNYLELGREIAPHQFGPTPRLDFLEDFSKRQASFDR